MILRPESIRMIAITNRGRNRQGMTLIEVLVAMAVFLLALAGIAQLIDFGTNSAVEAARTTTATRLCQSKMAEVEAGVVSMTEGGQGTFEEEPLWQWSVTLGAELAPYTFEVTVRVWIEQGRPVEVSLAQIIYDPQYMGNAAPAVAPETTTTTPERP